MGTLSGPLARPTLLQYIISTMAGANEAELREAFKLFDADGDGMISAEELVTLSARWADRWRTPRRRLSSTPLTRTATWASTSASSPSSGKRSMGMMRERSEPSLERWTLTAVDTSRETRWWQLSPLSSKETRWRKPRKRSTNLMSTRMVESHIQSLSWS